MQKKPPTHPASTARILRGAWHAPASQASWQDVCGCCPGGLGSAGGSPDGVAQPAAGVGFIPGACPTRRGRAPAPEGLQRGLGVHWRTGWGRPGPRRRAALHQHCAWDDRPAPLSGGGGCPTANLPCAGRWLKTAAHSPHPTLCRAQSFAVCTRGDRRHGSCFKLVVVAGSDEAPEGASPRTVGDEDCAWGW